MTVYKGFEDWLNALLSKPLPSGIAAFNFNLYENSDEQEAGFAVQLIGVERFDDEDPDWACDEAYSSEEELFFFSSDDWEDALDMCAAWIECYLESGKFADILKACSAVACGFVDGDLVVVHKQ